MPKAKRPRRVARQRPVPKSRKMRKRVTPGSSRIPGQLVSLACSQLDPFCEHARGAKVLDDSSSNSFTYMCWSLVPIISNASGGACVEFFPSLAGAYRFNTVDASGTITALGGSSAIPNYSTLGTSINSWRVVSFGVHLTEVSNALNAAGYLRMESSQKAASIGDSDSTYCADSQIYANKPGQEVHWVSKAVGANADIFIQPDYTVPSASIVSSRNSLRVWVHGCPASTNMYVAEIVMHIECLPVVGTLLAETATPGAPEVPAAMKAARNASASLPSSLPGNNNSFGASLKDAAKGALMGIAQAGVQAAAARAGPWASAAAGAAFGRLFAPSQSRTLRLYDNIMEVD